MLTGKKIVLGVSGGIAAYKMANVASMLSKLQIPDYVHQRLDISSSHSSVRP